MFESRFYFLRNPARPKVHFLRDLGPSKKTVFWRFPLVKPLKKPKIFRALRAQLLSLGFIVFKISTNVFILCFIEGGLMLSPWY